MYHVKYTENDVQQQSVILIKIKKFTDVKEMPKKVTDLFRAHEFILI